MNRAREFTVRLADLLRREHAAMADFLVALADFDRNRLWLELGYASLFHFLHRELGLSKGAAHYRKVAAELVQNYPEIIEPLRDGRLCITSVVSLAKVLTPENRGEMFPRFFHRSRREAMEIAVTIRPAAVAPRRDVVTAFRSTAAIPAAETAREAAVAPAERGVEPSQSRVDPAQPPVHPDELVVDPAQVAVQPAELRLDVAQADPPSQRDAARVTAAMPHAPPPPAAPLDSADPITADLRRLHVTVSRRFLEKLEAARSALSHARPGASAEEILEAGLDLVLARHAKRKGLVAKPRKECPPAAHAPSAQPSLPAGERVRRNGDHIPAYVKRAVWLRDGGRCSWPLEGGGICGSTLRLEFDHIQPRARGGPSTVENVRVACKLHNGIAARRAFGDRWMDQYTRSPTNSTRATPPNGA